MSEHLWKNFAPSCERNQDAILTELVKLDVEDKAVLEIGSLSGQHACYLSQLLNVASWQPSDIEVNITALTSNIQRHGNQTINTPIPIDVAQASQWPNNTYDLVYTANTFHIMSWEHVQHCFSHLTRVSKTGTYLAVYGPFKFDGNYTSESNANFNQWLQARDQHSAIRDFEAVNELAKQAGFQLFSNTNMPANNQMIIWQFI